MHSSHRGRRHRDKGGDTGRVYNVREGDHHGDTYGRSHRYSQPSEDYGSSSAYGTNGESSSRRRNDEWGDERYYSSDAYGRDAARDQYEHADRRDDEWQGHSHYAPSTTRDWETQRNAGESSYTESSWRTSDSYGRSSGDHYADDTRRPYYDEHERSRRDDRSHHASREDYGWHRGDRRERDDGWRSTRGDDTGTREWREPPVNRTTNSRPAGTEDRSWEPAPSWKNREQSAGGPGSLRKQNKKRKVRNNNIKRAQRHQRERDGRTDEDDPNNWTRRDARESPSRNGRAPKRKQRTPDHSHSRSRSHSPAASYSSRHTSRSRSPANSIKRRRQDYSPNGRHSRSPAERRTVYKPDARHSRHSPRSPALSSQSPRPPRPARRRSVSSLSTRSRSPSPNPNENLNKKSAHRLPTATSADRIAMTLPKNSLLMASRELLSRDANERVTISLPNGKHAQAKELAPVRSDQPLAASTSMDMPPPPEVPVRSNSHQASAPSKPISTGVKAGFKPIGQPSSSMRRFFPGDDDDMSVTTPTASTAQVDAIPDSMSATTAAVGQTAKSFRNASPSPMRGQSPSLVPRTPPVTQTEKAQTTPSVSGGVQDDEPQDAESSRPRELYEIVSQVGEGTFGKVYKARNTVSGVYVALKRIRMEAERDGFPVTATREIKLLQSVRHQNVVQLYEMMVSNGNVYMVFEYMDHDLTGILSQTQFSFDDAHLKSLCQQMLAGLAYLHHKGVIHRDIKGSNILLNNRGELKLADFGLARFYQKRRRTDYTNRVITLWYRPPELLYGATVYGPEVDMWSAGCIMLELFTRKPVFQGNDEIHQLHVVFKVMGTPTTERWSELSGLPWYELIKPKEEIPNHFRVMFQKWIRSEAALDLAERLLEYDPAQRITAAEALEAPYFTQEEPAPALPSQLSMLEGEWHELETKREREKKRRREQSMQ